MIAKVGAKSFAWVRLTPFGLELLIQYLAVAKTLDPAETIGKYQTMDGSYAFSAEKLGEIFGGIPFSKIYIGGHYTLRMPSPLVCEPA